MIDADINIQSALFAGHHGVCHGTNHLPLLASCFFVTFSAMHGNHAMDPGLWVAPVPLFIPAELTNQSCTWAADSGLTPLVGSKPLAT